MPTIAKISKTITFNQEYSDMIKSLMKEHAGIFKDIEDRCKKIFNKSYSSVTNDGGGQLALDIETTKR
jgi:hypothetical protein